MSARRLPAPLRCSATARTSGLIARSSDYLTPPWGIADQPPFVNLCIAVETVLAPLALLARAQAVERACGRDRSQERRWGRARSISTFWPTTTSRSTHPELTLPHPRLLERAFVLVPLAEIAPERVIAGIAISEALARVDAANIVRLPARQD